MKKLINKFKNDLLFNFGIKGVIMLAIFFILVFLGDVYLVFKFISIAWLAVLYYVYFKPMLRLSKIRGRIFKENKIEELAQAEYKELYNWRIKK